MVVAAAVAACVPLLGSSTVPPTGSSTTYGSESTLAAPAWVRAIWASSATAAASATSCRFAVGACARGTLVGREAGAHAVDGTGEFVSMLASTRRGGDGRSAGGRASSSEHESSSRFMHWAAGGANGCASGILAEEAVRACAWSPERVTLPCSATPAEDDLHASLTKFCLWICRLRQTCIRRQPPCLPGESVTKSRQTG